MNAITPPPANLEFLIAKATDQIISQVRSDDPFLNLYLGLLSGTRPEWAEGVRAKTEGAIRASNAIAKAFRANTRAKEFPNPEAMVKSGVMSKATLDVGTLTNFANITGGQSLGYVSLDTQMARGTVRPNSFTLYQCLHKTAAFQVVDYWATAQETGGGLPGTAFQGYSNVSSGNLATGAGIYSLSNITLKLAVNGRAITTALAAQNSFVDVTAQENINAALTVLESVNWTSYWGNPTFYANQFKGIQQTILGDATASGNIFDYTVYKNNYSTAQGWSDAQTLFNLIYEAAGMITNYRKNGRTTHAFMSPNAAAALQGLVTTRIDNFANLNSTLAARGIVVDGDLQGIRTRFGEVQFPIDMFITARDIPAQAIVYSDGTSPATLTTPTKPVSVTAAVSAVTGQWTAAYIATSGIYSYAVANTDTAMNESTLTYLSSGVGVGSTLTISGVGLGTVYKLTITPPVAVDGAAFRVYRSGLGYQPTSVTANPSAYRYIGTVAANGATPVTFTDDNSYIPGSDTIFLLDMDEADNAIDYRFLLPLTRIELFAQNLFMPWAVCSIGAIRLRLPKFHGYIKNFVGESPAFNPLAANF